MCFKSIIFNKPEEQEAAQHADLPPFFVDLNLDQVVDTVVGNYSEYDLKPFFYFPLSSIDEVLYRQEVFHDLENATLYEHVRYFAERMREVRKHLKLVDKLYYKRQKEIWFLYAVEVYCETVKKFAADLSNEQPNSRGIKAFNEYLTSYTVGSKFKLLTEEIKKLKTDLGNVKYRIIIRDNSFTVQNYEPGIDYSDVIEKTFQKFKQGAVKDYLVKYNSVSQDMNHIEVQILDFVAQLNSDVFSRLENFNTQNKNFIDETISVFDKEIHFYISYIENIKKFKSSGLKFCYPAILETSSNGTSIDLYDYEAFDLALAQKLSGDSDQLVCNDFYLKDKERIIVVTGPNQGGKTTFARMFGQLHYLASLGCPVPGSEAKLYLFDNIFTQFERSEKVENLRGKLEDDLTRIHNILEDATSRSIIIMNEIFNSTTLEDVSFLSAQIMDKILGLDLICVWVTFIDELASYSEKTVSMTSTIVPDNPAMRTFKIVRRQADGLAYALAIAEKYKLTYCSIKERIKR